MYYLFIHSLTCTWTAWSLCWHFGLIYIHLTGEGWHFGLIHIHLTGEGWHCWRRQLPVWSATHRNSVYASVTTALNCKKHRLRIQILQILKIWLNLWIFTNFKMVSHEFLIYGKNHHMTDRTFNSSSDMVLMSVGVQWDKWLGADNWNRAVIIEETDTTSIQRWYKNIARQLADISDWHGRLNSKYNVDLCYKSLHCELLVTYSTVLCAKCMTQCSNRQYGTVSHYSLTAMCDHRSKMPDQALILQLCSPGLSELGVVVRFTWAS